VLRQCLNSSLSNWPINVREIGPTVGLRASIELPDDCPPGEEAIAAILGAAAIEVFAVDIIY